MKQFIDFIPLLLFFIVWRMDERVVSIGQFERTVGGIFRAAEFLLIATVIVYGSLYVMQKRLDKFQWITVIAVLLLCTPTVVFQNTDFLKWKAPIVNWVFAAIFLGSRYIGEKPAIEHMMGHAINAPKELWLRLNTIWIYYFVTLGIINALVAFGLSEAMWIQFKVFGNLILTFVFVMGQMPLLAKYIEEDEEEAATEAVKEESI